MNLFVVQAFMRIAASSVEGLAYDMAAVTGGVPRVFTEKELLIADAGVGVNLQYILGGKHLRIEIGSADYPVVVNWLRSLADEAKVTLSDKRSELLNPSNFGAYLGKVLQAKGIRVSNGNDPESQSIRIVGGLDAVQAATALLFGKHAVEQYKKYFDLGAA